MVNKGRIHEELMDFEGIVSNSIKIDKEVRWEIRDFSNFIKRTPRRIHGIKTHLICISSHEEIKKKKLERKIDHEERENQEIIYNLFNLWFETKI